MIVKVLLKPKNLACLAMLIALQVVLNRFISIQSPAFKISFSFIPVMFSGVLFGPLAGALVGGISDFLGAMLFPFGAFFPGYTLTAALSGAIYGLLLQERRPGKRIVRIVLAYTLTALIVTLGLNTLFIAFQNEAYAASESRSLSRLFTVYWLKLPKRFVEAAIMLPVQIITTYFMLDVFRLDARILKELRIR